ncbi:hypothetical protein EXIGLDRAFT_724944 [Exidia glandulosa HHB12029]|uniref:Uncharacterized protein n=1 Tax=Exidia glandulosa HHB12029 TaxID=1314781 RepID=A0A165MM31_EXIGL|nr:hypothetical protein EXIGLDRAFT_724944 [Exidia glandulosa HHB12029]
MPTVTFSADLKALVVISNDNGLDLRDVLRCIPHGQVPVVCTGFRSPTSSTGTASVDLILDVSTALNRPIESLSLYSWGTLNGGHDLFDVWMETFHGTHRRIIMHSEFSLRDAVMAYHSLTILAISEVAVPEGSGEYELPYLTHLSVALLESGTQSSRGHNSVFLLEPRPNPVLLCPILEIVGFVAYPWHPTIIAPEMISTFLQWHVKCSRPPVLRLSEIALVQNNVPEVAALLGLISDIQESRPTDSPSGRHGPTWNNRLPNINDILSWETEMTKA